MLMSLSTSAPGDARPADTGQVNQPGHPPGDVERPEQAQVPRPARNRLAWASLATPWPLTLVLAAQAALSLRLVWSNAAFPDEALYLWVGRLEIAHVLQGGHVPDFATSLSGAPVLYPPLAAIAASAGGLAAARLLSLCLMLCATVLLHGLSKRLYDRRAAFFAAALFAGLAGTQFLGAFATYDAMALCLVACASWLAVVAASRPAGRRAALLIAAGAVLALSNATKYAAGIFDPVVVCLAAAAAWRARGPAAAASACAITLAITAGLLACGLAAGGAAYWHGLDTTTLARPPGSDSVSFLLYASGKWIGVVALLAGLGALAAVTGSQGRPFAVLTCVLAVAVVLVPIEQARIHTYTSMFKHEDYGAWFGCAAAGYAVAALARLVPRAKAWPAFQAGLAAAVGAVLPAVPIATEHYGWPDFSTAMARMRTIVARHPGPILADDGPSLLNYYLGNEVSRDQITGNWYYAYSSHGKRLTGDAAYEAAIANGRFAVIMLDFWDSPRTDGTVARAITLSGNYRLVALLPYTATGVRAKFHIWVRKAGP